MGERRRLLRAFSQACETPPNKTQKTDSKPSIKTSPQEDFTYSAAHGEITITGYRGRGHVVIPDKFDDLPLPVRTIGDAAFKENGMILSVVIPQGCTDIGSEAFWGCSSMETVEIPSSVNYISDSAFGYCCCLKSVTIPDRVTYIGLGAFEGCESLVNLKIPDKVTSIGHYAFFGCNSLERVTIPNSVTFIGDYAFDLCQPAVLKAYMQWRKSSSPSILTDPILTPMVQQILKQVAELSEFYDKANSKDRSTMLRNIRESYEEEWMIAGRTLGINEFIVNIQNSIGWDFAFPDSPVDQSIEK